MFCLEKIGGVGTTQFTCPLNHLLLRFGRAAGIDSLENLTLMNWSFRSSGDLMTGDVIHIPYVIGKPR